MLYQLKFARLFGLPTILLILTTGCPSLSTPPPPTNLSISNPTVPPDKFRISEISYEWIGGWGVRDGYKITLSKDGTGEYFGDIAASRQGKYRGSFDTAQFDQLASVIIQKDFFSRKNKYSSGLTDADTIIISVVYAGGRKTVVNYGGGGDDEVVDIQRAIVSLSKQI